MIEMTNEMDMYMESIVNKTKRKKDAEMLI